MWRSVVEARRDETSDEGPLVHDLDPGDRQAMRSVRIERSAVFGVPDADDAGLVGGDDQRVEPASIAVMGAGFASIPGPASP